MLLVDNKKYSAQSFLDEFQSSTTEHLIAICDVIRRWEDENDYVEITTSGSTSTPQIIRLPKASMIKSAEGTQDYFKYKPGDKSLLCLPIKFIGGMMMLVRSIVSNLDLYIVESSLRPLSNLSLQFDFVPMTPAQLSASLMNDRNEIELIDKILLGGGPVSSSLFKKIDNLKSTVYHSFGMTETISHIAIRQLNHTVDFEQFVALNGVKFNLDNESCLVIDADYIEGTVRTNDIVELISDSQFIWKGRKDNVINSGGLKLYPELIEQKISNIIEQDFFIAGVEDVVLGSKVCLIIESDNITDGLELLNAISSKLEKYETPKVTFTVSNFIKTTTGKIRRAATLNKAINQKKIISN